MVGYAPMRSWLALPLSLSLTLVACGQGDDPDLTAIDAGPTPDARGPDARPDALPAPLAGCNPIVGDDCMTPFPSAFFEVAAATVTGVRVAIPDGVLPVSTGGTAISPARLNQKDGFSPASPFLVYLKAGVAEADLPKQDELAASIEPTSPIQIIEAMTGARVPLFAELDANAGGTARKSLLIHPMVRLKAGTRYIVAFVGVHDGAGQPLAPAPFALLRDQGAVPDWLAPLAPRYEEIFAALEAAGLARASLSLAWDVTTASDQAMTSHLVGMRDQVLALVDAGMVDFHVTSSTDTPDDVHRMREVVISVAGPSFLASSELDATMNFGADGQPALRGTTDFPVVVEIPKCAASADHPLPFVVFGHGLFGTAKDTLNDPRILEIADRLCMVVLGTDWIGLSTGDLPTVASSVLADLNNIAIVTDRLQQAHANVQTMTRLFMTAMKDDPALAIDGHPISDGAERYYFGVSLGGIEGATFMGISPDVVRGVLNVPGAEWSFLMWRSTDFNELYPVLALIYPDALDRQLITAAAQSEFDYADPATFAPHLLGTVADPLPGTPAKRIIIQESIGDAQVSNRATEILARTIGLAGLELVRPVFGIVAGDPGPLDSAYTQWDSHAMPLPPTTNVPAQNDNGAHNDIQGFVPLKDQIARFFTPDGRAEATCGGPCDFPGGSQSPIN
jgi:hypothetical protein